MTELPAGRVQVSGRTTVLGIFGDPVSHSLSPVMQNEALRQAGFDAIYVPFHVPAARLPQAVDAIAALGLRGVNVTIPHKEAVCTLLDELDDEAELIGAVNTVVNEDGRLKGFNTDGAGLVRSLREDLAFDPRGRRVLLLGAGGAARAAIVALARAGCVHIDLVNRTRSRAEELRFRFQSRFSGTQIATHALDDSLRSLLPDSDLVVNTTSIGLRGEAFADFPWDAVSGRLSLYDMVYRPGGTPLVNQARRLGVRAVDGLGMLAAQGELSFCLWMGRMPPSGVMKRRLLAEIDDRRT
ncbi:shikimate dehydrogenase [Geothermobacter ehrlichii]|uniref:Shikimate dehydrogenase (NADP(+)) n=1 Tax=Geothermobacter ehrlichii TaxID=213224 RepID=A0A5D3WP07_9BACT|nr:shikimate dehydrogenase [Geothermobacter ehrlichii]TYO99936.1 shikimate dehydrogenase [Geothermobacter ehrlichii]